jgi:hypothetical protein
MRLLVQMTVRTMWSSPNWNRLAARQSRCSETGKQDPAWPFTRHEIHSNQFLMIQRKTWGRLQISLSCYKRPMSHLIGVRHRLVRTSNIGPVKDHARGAREDELFYAALGCGVEQIPCSCRGKRSSDWHSQEKDPNFSDLDNGELALHEAPPTLRWPK